MILIALGGNRPSSAGAPADTLRAALAMLALRGVRPLAVSRFYRSPAWPDPSDPEFTNAVAAVETDLSPAGLMAVLHEVEAAFGRERRARNAPRTLDLDIVDYVGRVDSGADAGPILPHPRAHDRVFVLAPLLEIAPDWIHPVTGIAGKTLLEAAESAGNRAFSAD